MQMLKFYGKNSFNNILINKFKIIKISNAPPLSSVIPNRATLLSPRSFNIPIIDPIKIELIASHKSQLRKQKR